MRLPDFHGQSGFTMIEIIAVLILLSIVAAIATSHIGDTRVDVVGATEVLKGHLRYSQVKAMNSATPWGINFNSGSYVLEQNGSASATPLPGKGNSTLTLPAGVTVSSTIDPLNFDQWGSPGAVTATVTVTDGTNTRTITITKNTGFIP